MKHRILVIGAGMFGVTAALELKKRGHEVTLIDPGPLPHPEASSTDISKVVRPDYGSEIFYAKLAQQCIDRWHEWNAEANQELYHETGYLVLAKEEMQPGGFEYESWKTLVSLDHPVEKLTSSDIINRFPGWSKGDYHHGYFNHRAGWVESGNVVSWLLSRVRDSGVHLVEGQKMVGLLENGSRISGVVTDSKEEHFAEVVVVATGAWTPILLPWLSDSLRCVGQPVYHFLIPDLESYKPERFPAWSADITNTGWYGLPALPDGTLKVAHHGAGIPMDPRSEKIVPLENDQKFCDFLKSTFDGLANSPILERRLCLYCDSWDGDFLIGRDPDHEGLIVASGGSGHGFKFAPMLGQITADVVEGIDNPWASRFRWRTPGKAKTSPERYRLEIPETS